MGNTQKGLEKLANSLLKIPSILSYTQTGHYSPHNWAEINKPSKT